MGWTYRHRKWRDNMRKAYTEETGLTDHTSLSFLAWVDAHEAAKLAKEQVDTKRPYYDTDKLTG